MLRAHADDYLVVGRGKGVDQLLHQPNVGRAEAAETEVENGATGSRDMAWEQIRPPHA